MINLAPCNHQNTVISTAACHGAPAAVSESNPLAFIRDSAPGAPMELNRWKIFRQVDPTFLSYVRIALAVGCDGPSPEPLAAIMVLRNDDVFSVGTNVHGCLGVSGVSKTSIPLKIHALCGKGVKSLSAGFAHVLAVTNSGRLLIWGDNKVGQLGLGLSMSELMCSVNPEFVRGQLEGKKVVEAVCGLNHTLAVTSDGEVFGWGNNKHGRIGLNISANICSPRKITFPREDCKIASVACGRHFSLALSDDGEVFTWGSNEYGQLGTVISRGTNAPQKLWLHVPIKAIACGPYHGMALSRDGKLFFWGQHLEGVPSTIVHPKYHGQRSLPRLVAQELGPVFDIAATHLVPMSVIRAQEGIYVWGNCFGGLVDSPLRTNFHGMDEAFAFCSVHSVMYRDFHCQSSGQNVAAAWQKLFEQSKNTDVEFMVGGKVIPAHRIFLEFRSEGLAQLLSGSDSTKESKAVEIKECSHQIFHYFLLYLYSDRISVGEPNQLIELMTIAKRFREMDLDRRCQCLLSSSINSQNLGSLYEVALDYDAEILKSSIQDFVQMNYGKDKAPSGKTLIPCRSNVVTRILRELGRKE